MGDLTALQVSDSEAHDEGDDPDGTADATAHAPDDDDGRTVKAAPVRKVQTRQVPAKSTIANKLVKANKHKALGGVKAQVVKGPRVPSKSKSAAAVPSAATKSKSRQTRSQTAAALVGEEGLVLG